MIFLVFFCEIEMPPRAFQAIGRERETRDKLQSFPRGESESAFAPALCREKKTNRKLEHFLVV